MSIRTISRQIDTANHFPSYASAWQDKNAMIDLCPHELRFWRQCVIVHASMTTVSQKMTARPRLESAFDSLLLAAARAGIASAVSMLQRPYWRRRMSTMNTRRAYHSETVAVA